MEKQIDLDIKGMSCASCAARVEKVLKKDPGVIEASVNLASEKASVRFHDDTMSAAKLVDMVNAAGYEARLPVEEKKSEELNPELIRLILSTLLTLPLVLPMLLSRNFELSPQWQLGLASIVQFGFGFHFYRSAFSALKLRMGHMDQLVVLGTSSAYFLSLYLMTKSHMHHLYFESSATVITLVMLGKYLEGLAKRKTRGALVALNHLRPDSARVGEMMVPISQLKIGELVTIKAGERIPCDGEIVEGSGVQNEAMVTGESTLISKKSGDQIIGGALNEEGVIIARVTRLGSESFLGKIIRMVDEAQVKKAPLQKMIDRLSSIFVPVILAISILTLVITFVATQNLEISLIHAVAVLVIACPCAMGLATPTAIMVGTGEAAKRGILFKDADVLEISETIRTVVFDKTGTLTLGKPKVSEFKNFSGDEVFNLRVLHSLQALSEHSLAAAVLNFTKEYSDRKFPVSDFKTLQGKGVEGVIEGDLYYFGTPEGAGLKFPATDKTLSVLVKDGVVLQSVSFEDEVRPEAKEAIARLKKQNLKVVMITGDNEGSARAVAESLGIDEVFPRTLPHEKAQRIIELKEHGLVIMVGDGINDAPALAEADLGIAMGSGTDVALQTASVTLLRPKLDLVFVGLMLARATHQKIKQNLFWAFIYNVIGIPLAALGYLSPMIAGGAMALSSVCVILNALTLKNWKLK